MKFLIWILDPIISPGLCWMYPNETTSGHSKTYLTCSPPGNCCWPPVYETGLVTSRPITCGVDTATRCCGEVMRGATWPWGEVRRPVGGGHTCCGEGRERSNSCGVPGLNGHSSLCKTWHRNDATPALMDTVRAVNPCTCETSNTKCNMLLFLHYKSLNQNLTWSVGWKDVSWEN